MRWQRGHAGQGPVSHQVPRSREFDFGCQPAERGWGDGGTTTVGVSITESTRLAMGWKEFEPGISAATARLRKSIDSATG